MAAPGWEMGFIPSSAPSNAISFTTTKSTSPAYLYGLPSADTLRIDDLLDFTSHHEDLFIASSSSAPDPHLLPPPDHPSSFPADSSSNLYSSFPDDLYIPSEEAAELEWLSRFVDDSFSDVPLSAYMPVSDKQQQQHQQQHLRAEQGSAAPGRAARSKRCKANSWLAMQAMPSQSSSPSTTSSSSSSDFPAMKPKSSNADNNSVSVDNNGNTRNVAYKGKNVGSGGEGGVRRCTHCASEKTPQWRTGPLGPKTLCNACGVRYKSGRLVPEYRPAASPTFVLTQHSNSHRKVLELRRQKELLLIRHDNHSSASASASAGAARPELLFHDYEVC
ncbi:hypothetical protein J5N97_029826 [Dioscorea zingiberensis]|uniref:GATA-type domain-containing protein n=1 Tax=Dioscorea zingiberensis TaxID=325984 RepID=A0A9D5H3J7_9LILI|nr:hypothetical protein J5N97_029826 [Dioscorea zingiberensis]